MTTPSTHRSIVVLKLPIPVPAMINVVKAILAALTNNASFPNPDPPLPVVNAALTDLEFAEAAALKRAKGAAGNRNQKRAALIALLQALKGYVQKTADSADPTKAGTLIVSAGMEVKKVPIRAKRSFSIKQGAVSGSIKVVTVSAGHRASYEWETSTDGGKTWQLAPPTLQARTAFTGLAPGSTITVRYRAVIKAGPGDWVEPISFLVK